MIYALITFAGTATLAPLAIRIVSSLNLHDVSNRRSSHSGRVLRGLGLAPAVSCVVVGSTAAVGWPDFSLVIGGGAVLGALGFVDDLKGLSIDIRLPIQFVVGLMIAMGLLGGASYSVPLIAAATLWVVGYVNAFNFMDGINGISGFHAAATGIAWSVGGVVFDEDLAMIVGAVIAAGALGFLPYNFPRARAFLGDVGSYFFGGWIAAAAVVVAMEAHILLAFLPVTIYVADTAWTLVLRVRRGEVWHEAHRDHVYQRFVRGGWSHTRTTVLVGALTLVLGGFGIVGSLGGTWMAVGSVVGAGLLSALYLAGPRIAFDEVPAIGETGP